VITDDCPLCARGHDESRPQASRRIEALAAAKPTARNKRRARLARACFEPLSERASKIYFLTEAQRDYDDMDMSFFTMSPWDDIGSLGPVLSPRERALRLAREGSRVAPSTPWWILENI
jgi:hypothetical protein